MPSGTEMATASPNPISTRCTLAQVSVASDPDCAMSSPAAHTFSGEGRNVGDTISLADSTYHATSGTATDSVVRIHLDRVLIGLRMANSRACRRSGLRRARSGHASRPRRGGSPRPMSVSTSSSTSPPAGAYALMLPSGSTIMVTRRPPGRTWVRTGRPATASCPPAWSTRGSPRSGRPGSRGSRGYCRARTRRGSAGG